MNLPGLGPEPLLHPGVLFEYSVDEPLPGSVIGGLVLVKGWAFSTNEPVSRVEVWLDNTRLGYLDCELPRPDVGRAYPGKASANCGYRGWLDFNPSVVGSGEKSLRLLISDRAGNRQELSVAVQVQTPGNGPTVAAYRQWRQQPGREDSHQTTSLIPLSNPLCFRLRLSQAADTNLSQLQATLDSLQNQDYAHWELCLEQAQWVALAAQDSRVRWLSEAEAEAEADWLVLIEAGDQLAPQALFRLYEWLIEHPQATAVYADEDWLDETGERSQPFFKPDWSPEYLRQTNYSGPLLAVRPTVAGRVLDEAGDEPALAVGLWLTEQTGLQIGHLAEVLYHRNVPLAAARLAGQAELITAHLSRIGRAAVAQPRPDQSGLKIVALPRKYYPMISVLLRPGPLAPGQLEKYLDQFFDTVLYPNLELLILESGGGSRLPALPMPVHYLRFSEKAGLSQVFNQAAALAEGDYLLFLAGLNSVLSADWLEHLLDYAEQPEIGAVGGLCLTAHNTIAEAGLRLHPRDGVQPILRGYPATSSGYGDALVAAREVSALSLQGLLLKKSLFEQQGGFNPLFESGYAGVDLCLRLRQLGFRLIFTPDAVVQSPGPSWWEASGTALEKILLLDIWQDCFEQPDAFYNPNFDQNYSDYRI